MYPKSHIGHTAVATAVLLLAAMTSTACQSNRVDDVPAKPKPAGRTAPGVQLDAAGQAHMNQVWATYLQLNNVYIKAAQTGVYNWDPDPANRPMYDLAAGQLLSGLERDLDFMAEQGVVRVGEPKIVLRRVVSVSATSILVESCVDDSAVDSVDKTTRKSVAAPGQNKVYPVTLRAGLYPDGKWRWVESHPDRASSC